MLKTRDMVEKANIVFFVGSLELLPLHGAALWNLSNPILCSLEVAFNNILCKLWRLPFNCHTRILHLTANSKACSM